MRTGLEPVTPCVTGMYSNQTELTHRGHLKRTLERAANETRTRDPDLGKVVLYQLSYCRITVLRGRRWIRTTEGNNQQIYSLPHLATLVSAQTQCVKEVTPAGFKPTTF